MRLSAGSTGTFLNGCIVPGLGGPDIADHGAIGGLLELIGAGSLSGFTVRPDVLSNAQLTS